VRCPVVAGVGSRGDARAVLRGARQRTVEDGREDAGGRDGAGACPPGPGERERPRAGSEPAGQAPGWPAKASYPGRLAGFLGAGAEEPEPVTGVVAGGDCW
jgi:hypothetical protein